MSLLIREHDEESRKRRLSVKRWVDIVVMV